MLERLAGKLLSRFLSKYFILPGEAAQDDSQEEDGGASGYSSQTRSQSASQHQRQQQQQTQSSTQIAVWSGFISLENLQFRRSLANDIFQKKGLPFELVSGSVKRVEITIPWGQLRSLLSGNSTMGMAGIGGGKGKGSNSTSNSSDADVIIVLDGVSLLLATHYEFYDEKLKQSGKVSRRKELEEAMAFVADPAASSTSSSSSFQSYLKKRLLSEKMFNGLFDNLTNRIQIHIRNLHVRLEDLETDPLNPWSMGMTLESLHVTSYPDDGETSNITKDQNHANGNNQNQNNGNSFEEKLNNTLARKVVQLNHFSIYCNSLDEIVDSKYNNEEKKKRDVDAGYKVWDVNNSIGADYSTNNHSSPPPPELLPLQSLSNQPHLLSHAMHAGIPRRRPRSLNSNSRQNHGPMHTYLLHPLDGTCQAILSKPSISAGTNTTATPSTARFKPKAKLQATAHFPTLQINLTPSTLVHILSFHARLKHHLSLKRHRLHRPCEVTTPIKTHPRLWWKYVVKIIRKEVREGGASGYKSKRAVRWNWGRWHERVELRKRYGGLYQRWLEFGVTKQSTDTVLVKGPASAVNGAHHEMEEEGVRTQETTSPLPATSSVSSLGAESKTAPSSDSDEPDYLQSLLPPTSTATTQTINTNATRSPLTPEEYKEMRAIEDGSIGDLDVRDILLFRAMVNAKQKTTTTKDSTTASSDLPTTSASAPAMPTVKSGYRLANYLRSVVKAEDLDAQEECARLVAYLEKKEEEDAQIEKQQQQQQQYQQQQQQQGSLDTTGGEPNSRPFKNDVSIETLVVVSMETVIERGSISFFSKVPNIVGGKTTSSASLSQQHFCFFDVSFEELRNKYSILENFDSIIAEALIQEYRGKEYRSDGSCHIVFSRSDLGFSTASEHIMIQKNEKLVMPLDLKGAHPNGSATLRSSKRSKILKANSDENIFAEPYEENLPLIQLKGALHPPNKDVDASIFLSLEKIHFHLDPVFEWPRRFKEVLNASSSLRTPSSPNVNAFWEDLQMAYINSWESTKASLAAKAERALFKQKKLDVDIRIDCPALTIRDKDGTTLDVDLGTALFVTEHLAGVAKNDEMPPQKGRRSSSFSKPWSILSSVGSVGGGDEEVPSSPISQFKSCSTFLSPITPNGDRSSTFDSPYLGGYDYGETASAISMESGRRKRGRSFGYDGKLFSVAENKAIVYNDAEFYGANQRELMQCFYDNYRLTVGKITVSISKHDSNKEDRVDTFNLFQGSGLDFLWEKSVIPSDHNLSRMKLSCKVDDLYFGISRESLLCLGILIENLRKGSLIAINTPVYSNRDLRQTSFLFSRISSVSDDESSSTSSIVNENEFLDAIDEFEPDNANDWFDEKWISDTESIGDFTSNTFNRNEEVTSVRRRRRFPSISEVSSKSDKRDAYLSAENLAKLVERPDEDIVANDVADSQISGDEDSFYSVISLDDQAQLVKAIQEDISRAEEDINHIKEKIKQTVDMYKERWQNDGSVMSKQEVYKQRDMKKKLRLELLRAEAELNALNASYREIVIQAAGEKLDQGNLVTLESLETAGNSYIANGGESEALDDSVSKLLNQEAFFRAKSLMIARERRVSTLIMPDSPSKLHGQHSLTDALNKDLMFATIMFKSVTLDFREDGHFSSAELEQKSILKLLSSETKFTIHHRRFDTKMLFSVEKISAASEMSVVFQGGFPNEEEGKLSEPFFLKYPHLITVNTQRKSFFRAAIELRQHGKKSKQSTKAKLSFGPTELAPDSSFSDIISLVKSARPPTEDVVTISESKTSDDAITKLASIVMGSKLIKSSHGCTDINEMHQFINFDCSFSSLAVRVLDERYQTIGAAVLTGASVRLARRTVPLATQGQIDFQLTNAQILQVSESEFYQKAHEMLGRRNIFDQFIVARIRVQLAPKQLCGGWVVESFDEIPSEHDEFMWNLHIGARCNSLAMIVKPELSKVIHSGIENMKSFSLPKLPQKEVPKENGTHIANQSSLVVVHSIPIRWRIDLSLLGNVIILPGTECTYVGVTDVAGNYICLTWSIRVGIHPDYPRSENISINSTLRSDIATNSNGAMNVLDPCTVTTNVSISPTLFKLGPPSEDIHLSPLQQPHSFGSPDLGTTCDEEVLVPDGLHMALAIKSSSIIFNLCPLTCILAQEILSHFKHKRKKSVQKEPASQEKQKGTHLVSLEMIVPLILIKMHNIGPDHQTVLDSPAALLAIEESVLTFVTDKCQTATSLSIGEIQVFDATKSHVVPVFYTAPISSCSSNSCEIGLHQRQEKYLQASVVITKSKSIPKSLEFTGNVGVTHCVIMPSTLRAVTDFLETLKRTHKQASDPVKETHRKTIALPCGVSLIRFSISSGGVDLIIPSQDIHTIVELHDETRDDIAHVVCIQWKTVSSGTIVSCSDGNFGFTPVTAIIQESEQKNIMSTWEQLVKRIQGDEASLSSNASRSQKGNPLLAMKIEWKTNDLEIIRTGVRIKPGDKPYLDQSMRCLWYFEKAVGLFSEQKIISPFHFDFINSCVLFYNSFGEDCTESDVDDKFSSSYGLQIDVGFVDVIWHVAKSRFGLSDAYANSIRPILDILKRNTKKKENAPSMPHVNLVNSSMEIASPIEQSSTPLIHQKQNSLPIPKTVYIHLKQAIIVIAVRMKGINLTCVPSNATAVNLIPIMKVQLSTVRLGSTVTTCPSSGGVGVLKGSLDLASVADDGYESASLYFSAWSDFQLSAHYHNLRLLTWEPLIETWTANARAGINLSEVSNMEPYRIRSTKVYSLKASNAVDFSRLLRFILARGKEFDKTGIDEASSAEQFGENSSSAQVNGLDVCYILQCLIAPRCTCLAKHPSITHEDTQSTAFIFPTGNESKHLFHHGYPVYSGNDHISSMLCFSNGAAEQSLTNLTPQGAVPPLNLNLTGALVDTFMLSELGSKNSNCSIASHTIKNDSGLFLRWTGDLGERGELHNGSDGPLSLKRGFPHRNHITLELREDDFEKNSTCVEDDALCYKAIGRIPVDLVGIKQYALKQMGKLQQNLGATRIIVRVSMRGSAKIVSIESPVFVFNASCVPLNLRMSDKGKEIWNVNIPQRADDNHRAVDCAVPVPVTLVPTVNRASWKLSIANQTTIVQHPFSVAVSFPQSFSKKSPRKGLISSRELVLPGNLSSTQKLTSAQSLSINACSFRIGSALSAGLPPEQRMLAFRNTMEFRNNLPYSISIQVRVSRSNATHQRVESSIRLDDWVGVGEAASGTSIHWPLALQCDNVECRVKLLNEKGEIAGMGPNELLPPWSSSIFIPPEDELEFADESLDLVINNYKGVPLHLSALLERDLKSPSRDSNDDIRALSFAAASRVVSIYSRFIIADYSGQSLEFKSSIRQSSWLPKEEADQMPVQSNEQNGNIHFSQFGLSNLQKHDHRMLSSSVEMYMMGGNESSKLIIRQQGINTTDTPPWSEPIPLIERKSVERIVIPRPLSPISRPLVLCAKTLIAPEHLGGTKTKIVSIYNQYSIANRLDVDIEVISTNKKGLGQKRKSLSVGVNEMPIPWHFDDSGFIRLRPKELGWAFSGSVSLIKKRRDVAMRVRNKLTGKAIIITIEFNTSSGSPDILVVIRASRSIPFRIENLTTTPIEFTQQASFFSIFQRQNSDATIILPYHKSEYAWDEPDNSKRCIQVGIADFEFKQYPEEEKSLGQFFLDNLAPGTKLKIKGSLFEATIETDGATRVLRITDASIPMDDIFSNSLAPIRQHSHLKYSINVMLDVGVSMVDWSPRELLYFQLKEMSFHRLLLSDADIVKISIGKVSADCQLWLTPYPVLLSIGEQRYHSKKNAIGLSWRRDLDTRGSKYCRLLRDVNIKMDTLKLKIDGNLASLVAEMGIKAARTIGRDKKKENNGVEVWTPTLSTGQVVYTAATASKETSDVKQDVALSTDVMVISERNTPLPSFANSIEPTGVPEKPRQKYYIEKMKISSIKAEISWCGSLPLSLLTLPRWLSPALMFEALPIMFPPYSNAHVYGSAEEHIQNIKSHYNIWRFLFGLSFKPAFIIRSCVFTSSQSIANFFNNVSNVTSLLLDNVSGQYITQSKTGNLALSSRYFQRPIGTSAIAEDDVPGTLGSVASILLRNILFASNWASSTFKFIGVSENENSSIRSRAPRLFVNQDQNDVLVEYVDGQNAGKALLSRVRSGRHLSEGYILHGDFDGFGQDFTETPTNLFFILTFERLLVLTSGKNVNICNVVWEVCLDDITMITFSESAEKDCEGVLQFLYMKKSPSVKINQSGSPEHKHNSSGLDVLSSNIMLFRELDSGRHLLNEIMPVARFRLSSE